MRTTSLLLGSAGAFFATFSGMLISTASEAKTGSTPVKPPVFAKCAACHNVVKAGPNGVGPNLYGVGGRKAGTARGYSYSAALKKSGVTWGWKTLDRYIADPNSIAPDGKMPKVATTEADRKEIIAYLAKLR